MVQPGANRQELIDGELVVLPAPTAAHAACVNRLTSLLTVALGNTAVVSVQNPVSIDERSQPAPDIAVLKGHTDAVRADDVLLVIEVSDSGFSLTYDRGRKAACYARSGIPECWVVDLAGQQVLVHSAPASGGYKEIRNLRSGTETRLELASLPAISLSVEELLS